MSEAERKIAWQTDLAASLWLDIACCLEIQKSRVYEELRTYPTPITACDQQFNYLLEQQAKIGGELARVRKAIDESSTRDNAMELIEAFLKSSTCLAGELKQSIRARLHDGLLRQIHDPRP